MTKQLTFLLPIFLILLACSETPTTTAETKAPEKKETLSSEIDYEKHGIAEESINKIGALEVGTKAPDFSGNDQNGNPIQLSELTKEGDVVLVFYRGYWCPICTKNLATYVDNLDAIKAKGAQVIAIAPEGEQNIHKTVAETNLAIPFISDSNHKIMDLYGVSFKVSDGYNEKFSNWKKDLTIAQVNEQEEAYLPIPATYIIGQDGTIKWVHFDPNYRKRASVEDVLAAL